MLLNVDPSPTAAPQSVPTTGGQTTITFGAGTDDGAGQLQADYDLEQPSSYVLVGSTHLDPSAVSTVPRSFAKTLTLELAPGAAGDPFVRINLRIELVGGGSPTLRVCNVTMGAALSFGAPAPVASVGQRLRAFRTSTGLSQEAAAKKAGISRSQISHLETDGETAHDVLAKVEALLKG